MKKFNLIKKILCTQLIVLELFSFSSQSCTVYAQDEDRVYSDNKDDRQQLVVPIKVAPINDIFERVIADYVVDGTKWIFRQIPDVFAWTKDKITTHGKEGFNPLLKSKQNLMDIISENSADQLYGQENAKEKVFSYIMSCLYNIDKLNNDPKSKAAVAGNVIYLIGPSGCGKSTMAKAIANAILKDPDIALLFIDPSSISYGKTLDKQLFKIIEKKDIKNEDKNYGILGKELKAPILEHIEKRKEAIVIIDDYDKMKMLQANQMSKNTYDDNDDDYIYEDRTADEVLKSIAENGKYYADGNEVDCRKAIFIVTSNESPEGLKQNFGIGGDIGGGYQRLKIAEFDHLSFDACQKIIRRMICKVTEELTDFNGPFKLNSFSIDEQSIIDMANDIYQDKNNQGRLERTLYNDVLALFSRNIGEEYDKSFKVTYRKASGENLLGSLEKTEIKDELSSNFTTINSCAEPVLPPSELNIKYSADGFSATMPYKSLLKQINHLSKKDLCIFTCSGPSRYMVNNHNYNQNLNKKILVRLLKQIEQGNWINNNVIELHGDLKENGEAEVQLTFKQSNIHEMPKGNLQNQFTKAANKIRTLLNSL